MQLWMRCTCLFLLLPVLGPADASAAVGRWSSTGPARTAIVAIGAARSNPTIVFAASETTLFRRAADASGWTALPTVFRGVSSLLVSSADNRILVVGDQDGLHRSVDGGASWTTPQGGERLWQVVEDPGTPSRLYARSPSTGAGTGLQRSTDVGLTWSPMPPVLPVDFTNIVTVDPVDSNVLYMEGEDFLLGRKALFRSTDAGVTWRGLNLEAFTGRANIPVVLDRVPGVELSRTAVYTGDRNGGGVFRSTDGGETFTPLNPGRTDVYVSALALDPTDRNLLYVSTRNGVFSSFRGGWDGFTRISAGLPGLPVLCLSVAHVGRVVFAGTDGDGVYEYEPAGTWILPSSARIEGIGGAFYTTSLTLVNPGTVDVDYALRFLGNSIDGTTGPERIFSLPARGSKTHEDVLSTVFGLASGFGAIQITAGSRTLAISSQTSTPGLTGTFGQSVPAFSPADWVSQGTGRTIPGIREDAAVRTNLILANCVGVAVDATVRLISASGAALGSKQYALPPLGMTQVTKVVRDLGVADDVVGAYLIVETFHPAGALAVYASAIDNGTNDPRTLLPR